MKIVIGLALAAVASAAFAQTSDSSEARDGHFGAKLLITTEPESFWAQWAQPGTPHLTTADRITRGRTVETVIIFHDCLPAADGNCKVLVHYEMIGPDGQPYQKPVDGMAWNHPPAPEHNLMPSEAALGFKLDPLDKLGRYQIVATLTDQVAGKKLILRETLTAVEDVSPSSPAN